MLGRFDLDTLEREPHSVFAVSNDLRLVYFNTAYCEFANQNGNSLQAFPLESQVLDAVHVDLRGYFAERFARVLREHTPWCHEYLCLSPARWQEFRQDVYPLRDGSGLLFINTATIDRPLPPEDGADVIAARYLDASGLYTQCSNCRRSRRNDGSDAWDWVPALVRNMPRNTSHSICPPCFDYYWNRDSRAT